MSGTCSFLARLSLRMESAFTCQVLNGTVILLLPLPNSFSIGAAHERAFDVDVIAFAQLRRGVLAEAVPGDDAMPLRLGVPFFVGTLPGPLSRQRKNRVFAVCRSNGLVLRVLAEITDEMNYCFGTFCFSVSALVIGAPGSEWILLPRRAAAFWEGHKKSSMVFQKICWEEPEKQKTRSCRAQELSRSRAQWRG